MYKTAIYVSYIYEKTPCNQTQSIFSGCWSMFLSDIDMQPWDAIQTSFLNLKYKNTIFIDLNKL